LIFMGKPRWGVGKIGAEASKVPGRSKPAPSNDPRWLMWTIATRLSRIKWILQLVCLMDVGSGRKRSETSAATKPPARRRLRIYATDPMVGRQARYRVTIDVDNELLRPGPSGDVVEVIDYDGVHKRYYSAVNLDDPALLMNNGLDPSESDPRFHQQMVYAVAMKVIDSAQRALGRSISFYRSKSRPRLRLFPHAFHGENAFFDEKMNAILFGYFRARTKNQGPNLPGQNVFTCLSHDIIAHEVTHAIVHRLRPYFMEPTNEDVLAFHEAFSDIVALFQRFSYREILREHIQTSQARLQGARMMVELAQQFGQATGRGTALRSALGQADPEALGRTREPHRRGAILVSAVFDGFFTTYERRIADLLRIATGGSGVLPAGQLHPDLVARISAEAAAVADSILRMCIRAFDYLPPVDVTFGDFLRALVTADYELNPNDEFEMRHSVIEGFRIRGIYPTGVPSLAEESLLWEDWEGEGIDRLPQQLIDTLTTSAQTIDRTVRRRRRRDPQESEQLYRTPVIEGGMPSEGEEQEPDEANATQRVSRRQAFSILHEYAKNNWRPLALDSNRPIAVSGFHQTHRMGRDQRVRAELVAQFVQTDETRMQEFGGLPFRGGTTVVFGPDGAVRYVIAKPLPSPAAKPEVSEEANMREQRFRRYIAETDAADPRMAWGDAAYREKRMKLRMDLRTLHAGLT
jgi:hypothetical protein